MDYKKTDIKNTNREKKKSIRKKKHKLQMINYLNRLLILKGIKKG